MNKRLTLTIALLGSFLFFTHVNAGDLSTTQKREIVVDCTLLVNDYAYFYDSRDPTGFANIFTEGGRLQARGVWHQGRSEIAKHVMDEPPNTVTMHLVTTVKISPIDHDHAVGVSYSAVAFAPEDKNGSPAILENLVVVGKYFDKFTRTVEGWKISERSFTPIFMKPNLPKK